MAEYKSKKDAEKALKRAREEYAASRKVVNAAIKARKGKEVIEAAEKERDKKLKACEELRVVIENWF